MTDPASIMLAVRNIRRSVAIKPATSSAVSIRATIAKSQNRRSSDGDGRGGGAGKRWSINTMFAQTILRLRGSSPICTPSAQSPEPEARNVPRQLVQVDRAARCKAHPEDESRKTEHGACRLAPNFGRQEKLASRRVTVDYHRPA